jgi:hypothetical protein
MLVPCSTVDDEAQRHSVTVPAGPNPDISDQDFSDPK